MASPIQTYVGAETPILGLTQLNQNNYSNWVEDITNSGTTYTFQWETTDVLSPTNKNINSTTAVLKFKILQDIKIIFTYDIITEAKYDKLSIFKIASPTNIMFINSISGTQSGTTERFILKKDDVIQIQYQKDVSQHANNEKCNIQISFYHPTDNYHSVAQPVNKLYLGIDNIARKIKKVFIGDTNSIAQSTYIKQVKLNLYGISGIFSDDGVSVYVTLPAQMGGDTYSKYYRSGSPITVMVPQYSDIRLHVHGANYWKDNEYTLLYRYNSPPDTYIRRIATDTDVTLPDTIQLPSACAVNFVASSNVETFTFSGHLSDPRPGSHGYSCYVAQNGTVTYEATPKNTTLYTTTTISTKVTTAPTDITVSCQYRPYYLNISGTLQTGEEYKDIYHLRFAYTLNGIAKTKTLDLNGNNYSTSISCTYNDIIVLQSFYYVDLNGNILVNPNGTQKGIIYLNTNEFIMTSSKSTTLYLNGNVIPAK